MFDIGFLELALLGVVALLVLGPERLPTAAKTAGLWIGRARKMVGELTREVDRQLKTEEIKQRLSKEGDELGIEKIQKTVDDALVEANKFKHLVDQPVDTNSKQGRATERKPAAAADSPTPAIKSSEDSSGQSVTPGTSNTSPDSTSLQKSD